MDHCAGLDPHEPQTHVDSLEPVQERTGRLVRSYRCRCTWHWLFEPDRVDACDQAAADLAGEQTLAFLEEILHPAASG